MRSFTVSVSRCAILLVFGGIPALCAASQAVNPDAKALADFSARVKAYVQLVNKADAGVPPLQATTDPAKIAVAQDALAERIRAVRSGAQRGEIFTPDIQRVFRALLRPELKGKEGVETKETIEEESPVGLPLSINAKYPEKEPLSTVPPNILLSLPQLPEEVQYRFVGKHLILRDTRANIIVDFVLNAIP